jgi:hypothetical protein
MTDEMRRANRYPVVAVVEIIDLRTSMMITALISDLSLVGCYVDTLNPLPPGTDVRLHIMFENETFTAPGKVAHSMSNMGMGIEFTKLRRNEQEKLQKWLHSPNGNRATG